MRRGVTILTYHRVLPDKQCSAYPFPSLAMPLQKFRQHVKLLASHCTVLPVRAAYSSATVPSPSRPQVCVSFDDGYADNFQYAAPILEEFNMRATFFITADFVATRQLMWFDQAALLWNQIGPNQLQAVLCPIYKNMAGLCAMVSLGDWIGLLKSCNTQLRRAILIAATQSSHSLDSQDYSPMSLQQVAELHHRGHEIASHTLTHPLLPQLENSDLRRELQESRRLLTLWTGANVEGFSYPNGDHDERTVAAVKQAGYNYACTTIRGINSTDHDPMQLCRVQVDPRRVRAHPNFLSELEFRAELCLFFGPWR